MNKTIMLFEDDSDFVKSLKFRLKLMSIENVKIIHLEDFSNYMGFLEMYDALIIMIDHDLGDINGVEIIDYISSDPKFVSTSIIYYSSGLSKNELIKNSESFKCNINCYTKNDDDMYDFIKNKLLK